MLKSCSIRLGKRNEKKQVIRLVLIGRNFGNRKGKGNKWNGWRDKGLGNKKDRKEQEEWVERQKAWQEERKKEQAEWKAREKAWEERSQRELQERERGWAKEFEKKRREWEREQKWKWEESRKNLDMARRDSGDKVQQVGGPSINDHTSSNVSQPSPMNYYNGSGRTEIHYENNCQGNGVPNGRPQLINNNPPPNPSWNNQRGGSSPRDRHPNQRGRGGNLRENPQGCHTRINNRDQVCVYRDQCIPVREPKLSKYDGRIPWRVYEVKLMQLAKRYQWDDDTKLAKLVEALEDKALTFFSNLPSNVQGNFEVVRKKMNNRFLPQELAITARKHLQTIHQDTDEALEEWAERCQQCAYDAWGKISSEAAEQAAIEAFLGGVLEAEAAFTVIEKDPQTVDEALEFLRKTVHSRKSLCCRFRNTQRKVRTVSIVPDSVTAEVRTGTSNPTPPDSIQKFGAELKDMWSSLAETRKQLAKIVELLSQ